MIEYLYDTIRATAGADITITSRIEEDGECVDNVGFMLHLDNEHAIVIPGELSGEVYQFVIPANVTAELKGRYWYCFCREGKPLCFKEAIYFV
jgi:hypothetical protein